ncbi:SAM-dependent methyltransferase [Clostridium botulinum]|nr:SAM-dependent methyltransferase [Clostridium botulinum]
MFFLEYVKNPQKVGAVKASSKYLADEMLKSINFKDAKCIVEYGPGNGAFTEKILARAQKDTIVILIEINNEFFKGLNKLYGYKENVIILNESAENIDKILEKYSIRNVDYIVSGLPFASLPKEVSETVLTKTSKIIKRNGKFITFQYTLFKEKYIKNFFSIVNHKKVIRNFPPAYVLTCKDEKNTSYSILT